MFPRTRKKLTYKPKINASGDSASTWQQLYQQTRPPSNSKQEVWTFHKITAEIWEFPSVTPSCWDFCLTLTLLCLFLVSPSRHLSELFGTELRPVWTVPTRLCAGQTRHSLSHRAPGSACWLSSAVRVVLLFQLRDFIF